MGSESVLEVLRNRATDRREEIGQQLAQLQHERQQAIAQQQLLQHYRQDYQHLLRHESESGIYAYRRDNYDAFLRTVQDALTAQSHVLSHLDQQQHWLLRDWQHARQKAKALQVLIDRRAQRHQRGLAQAQQKANDEFASRRFQGAEE